MNITPSILENKNLINSYKEGKFLVNDKEYCSCIIVFPEKVIELKKVDIDNQKHFESFLTKEVEILLIGTGKTRNTPNPSVKAYLMERKGLNFEFMTTDAACRTHNVLILEDRFVVSYLVAL
ncbi:Mth938-like domain-containing protein [Wolbachia endosymbiont of Ctenocephalides felis wCfeT]|uniref:Mth938-like domain-containing protein n=1 Tax=Wolbachia endosymbiont of Ctenocephalides felis wCfeT TaxID=2732593 RepID=UPI0014487C62|nr:Mth938-like domain-containing protein [Wolbachia endosymbiont of Ctenocephalides felis wCfeT]